MRKDAFTLLEVIISMMILAIVTTGSFALIVTTNRFLNTSKHRLQAINQAQAVLDRLRYYVSADPNNPLGAGGVFNINTNNSPSIIGLSPNPNIPGTLLPEWHYTVSAIGGSECRNVEVTVEWDES